MENLLNITCGDAFCEYLSSEYGKAVPFREAMMDGDAVGDIFSDEFIQKRAQCLNVDKQQYISNIQVLCDALEKDISLCLWFGKDTFCQMNLLTLLAYLEKIDFGGKIILNYIVNCTAQKAAYMHSNIIP